MARRSNDGAAIVLLVGGLFGFLWSLIKYPIPTIIGVNVISLIFFPDYFGGIFGVSIVVGLIYFLAKKSNQQNTIAQNNKQVEDKYGLRQPDKNKSLVDRSEDIISKNLGSLYLDSWPYYVENKVRDCISDIAEAEGKKYLAPEYKEYLRNWSSRTDVPKEYLELKDELLRRFKLRYEELGEIKKKQDDEAQEKTKMILDEKGQKFLSKHKELIDKFFEITERKVSIIDDYGDENWDALNEEIQSLLIKIAKNDSEMSEKDLKDHFKGKGYNWNVKEEYIWAEEALVELFKKYHAHQKQIGVNKDKADFSVMSGIDFEVHLSKIFKENNYDVAGTPATGDQGADLIVKKNGKTIIIQAKCYAGNVGNKAVQEVVSATNFYDGDEGWVVTNSFFTPSAKALAQKNNIKLVDGHDLKNIEKFI